MESRFAEMGPQNGKHGDLFTGGFPSEMFRDSSRNNTKLSDMFLDTDIWNCEADYIGLKINPIIGHEGGYGGGVTKGTITATWPCRLPISCDRSRAFLNLSRHL